MSFEQFGIDVSYHQGVIDWRKVKDAGAKFAILRCGYGKENPNQIDKQYENNYKGCKTLGIPVGVYHYSYARTVEEAVEEAEFCLKLLEGKQFELPIFFDIEENEIHKNLSREISTAICYAFCETLEKAGYFAGIYTYDYFFNQYLEKTIEDRFAIACARYSTSPPQYCTNYGIWQNSSTSKIDGVLTDVDTDYMYVDYPLIIKAAGLNGFKKPEQYIPKFKVTGTKENLTEAESLKVREELSNLGYNTLLQRQED